MSPDTTAPPRAATDRPPRRRPASNRTFGLVALVPFAFFLLLFALYPLFQLVRTAFSDVTLIDGAFSYAPSAGENFTRIWTDDVALYSFQITAVFILVTVPVTLVLGVLLAVLVDRSVVFARIAHTVLLWPVVITPVVVSVVWFLILSPNVGGLNRVLASLGLPEQAWLAGSTGAIGSIMLVDVWHWTPLVFLLVFSAIRGIDPALLEAARVDGAGEWRVYGSIVLPLLAPAIMAAGLIRLTMGAKTFDEMYLLTRGGPDSATTLVSLYIRNVFFDELELGYGAALSVAVIVAIGIGVALVALGRWAGRLTGGGQRA